MNIVVLDGYTENPGDLSWAPLKALGHLTVMDRTNPGDEAAIIRRLKEADAAITNKTPISEAVLDACPRLRYIGVLATGYDCVDVKAAGERGIPVTNIPAYGSEAVGQFAIALLLEICHHIGAHDAGVHAGKWEKSPDWCYWDFPLTELSGKTLGVIGFGRIGQTTGRIAHAMGMRVIACSGHTAAGTKSDFAVYKDRDSLLGAADVIALHCPLTEETRGMINRSTIEKMKDGVILINNARGGLIVEQDLADALNTGKVAAAGLDVVSTEPIRPDNPLLHARNCIITPHISWAARECRERIMRCAADNLRAWQKGEPVNVVNM